MLVSEKSFLLNGLPNLITPVLLHTLLNSDVGGVVASFQIYYGWYVFHVTLVNNEIRSKVFTKCLLDNKYCT